MTKAIDIEEPTGNQMIIEEERNGEDNQPAEDAIEETAQEAERDESTSQDTAEKGNETPPREEAIPIEQKDEPATPIHAPKESDENDMMNKLVKSEEEAHRLYCEYGHKMGFSVRKGKQYYYVGTKNICTKDYYCSKEGVRDGDKLTEADYKDPHTRTNCKAMVRFRVDEEGNWRVVHMVKEHNHPLVKPEERHLLRSARSHTAGRQRLIDLMTSPFFQAINYGSSPSYSVQQPTQQEVKQIVKPVFIEGSESQSVVNVFKTKANEDGMFFWDVQLDQGGRMCNFFWRDGRSRIDYDSFGDVVVFDTSLRLNKYNMICAPFIGVNHHWQNIMFGCALLLDDKVESFAWLFRSFLESMGGRAPKSIFTDQNLNMGKAIEEVLPNTRHRIYQRYIHKNLMPRLGSLNLNDSKSFHKMFNKCLHGCDSEAELEETWSTMLKEFKLQDHKWLNNLYKMRAKWCTALNKDAYDGGIEWDQRTETMNNVLDGITDKAGTLEKCVLSVDKLTDDWREKEYEEDLHNAQKPIVCAIRHSDVLNHAAKEYTYKIYKLFELEFLDGCGATFFKETPLGGTLYRFECTNQGRGSKSYTVMLDISELVAVSCDCKKFETMGILCSHSLKAMSVKNVRHIPQRYIIKRWSKSARKRNYSQMLFEESEGEGEVAYASKVMRYAYDLVLKSQGHAELRDQLWTALEGGEQALEKFGEITNLQAHSLAIR